MSWSREMSLQEAIRQLLDKYKLTGHLNEIRLINSWEIVVGRVIAKHTKSLRIKNKVLYVEVDSAALSHELIYERSQLIKRLNNEVGSVVIEDIVVR